jgi:uncharacterized protein YfaA (DUF2138 family)
MGVTFYFVIYDKDVRLVGHLSIQLGHCYYGESVLISDWFLGYLTSVSKAEFAYETSESNGEMAVCGEYVCLWDYWAL